MTPPPKAPLRGSNPGPLTGNPVRLRHAPPLGFTLLEVLLALSIAIGLLAVVLHFHQQIARLRNQILADSAQLSAVRLCMDRIAMELRTAAPQPGTFHGSARELVFVRCVPSDLQDWRDPATTATDLPARSPYRRIRYRLPEAPDGAAATEIERHEEPLDPPETTPSSDQNLDPAGFDSSPANPSDPSASPAAPKAVALAQTLPGLRHLALRYWDGSAWMESWPGPGLPRGVEVSLASELPPPTAPPGTPPRELFRRVIALPTASAPLNSDSPGPSETSGWDTPGGTLP